MSSQRKKTYVKARKKPDREVKPIFHPLATDWVEIAEILWDKLASCGQREFLDVFQDEADFCDFIKHHIEEDFIMKFMHTDFGQGAIFGAAWRALAHQAEQEQEGEEEFLDDQREEDVSPMATEVRKKFGRKKDS